MEQKAAKKDVVPLWQELAPSVEFVLALVEFHPEAVENIDLVSLALADRGGTVGEDLEIAFACCKLKGLLFRAFSEEVRANRALAEVAIENSFGAAVTSIAGGLMKDRAFVLKGLSFYAEKSYSGISDYSWEKIVTFDSSYGTDPEFRALLKPGVLEKVEKKAAARAAREARLAAIQQERKAAVATAKPAADAGKELLKRALAS